MKSILYRRNAVTKKVAAFVILRVMTLITFLNHKETHFKHSLQIVE